MNLFQQTLLSHQMLLVHQVSLLNVFLDVDHKIIRTIYHHCTSVVSKKQESESLFKIIPLSSYSLKIYIQFNVTGAGGK